MSQLTYQEGDLFKGTDGDETIFIAHVCNDQGAWGAGFVLPLAKAYPGSRQGYLAWAGKAATEFPNEAVFTPHFELGQVQLVKVQEEGPTIYVANMLAQTLGGSRPVFYNHLARCMDTVAWAVQGKTVAGTSNPLFAHEPEGRIICPLFGSGLAGGDWNFVEELIQDCWVRQGIDVTAFYLPQFLPENWTPPPTGNFQVELAQNEFTYLRCSRCNGPLARLNPDRATVKVGGERCFHCSGYMLPDALASSRHPNYRIFKKTRTCCNCKGELPADHTDEPCPHCQHDRPGESRTNY